jgi:hypothetical protein
LHAHRITAAGVSGTTAVAIFSPSVRFLGLSFVDLSFLSLTFGFKRFGCHEKGR